MGQGSHVKYLLIGGGAASAQAAAGIREVDPDGSTLLVGKEHRPPYDRPPLTKGFLAGKVTDPEDIESKDRSFYRDKNVDLVTGVEAADIDAAGRCVKFSDGSEVGYDHLLLATGATPRRLNIPGADLPGVHVLRALEDSATIRDAATEGVEVVLVGSGYIGLEAAATLSSRGCRVTIVAPDQHPWSKFASAETGDFLMNAFKRWGVRFAMGERPQAIHAQGGRLQVTTESGGSHAADLVVVGIGVDLNLDLAARAGLTMDPKEGVEVDETLRTSNPSIWAAGDIANFVDIAAGGQRWHAEHYLNAKWHGKRVGQNMAGNVAPYNEVAYFFSDMRDLHMILRGRPRDTRSQKVIGSREDGTFVELYGSESGKLRMGMAFHPEEKKLDQISDRLEELIRSDCAVESVTESDFQL